MNNFKVLLKKDLLALWRTKKVLILGLVFILFALTSPVIAYYMPEIFKLAVTEIQIEIPETTILDSYLQLFNNWGQIGLFVLIALFVPEIIKERKNGQFTNLLNNNVTSSDFLLSKFISQLLIFSLVFLLSIACFGFYNFILFEEAFAANTLVSLTLIYVYFFFVISLCNFFSSFSKNMSMAMLLTFVIVLLMPILSFFKFGKYLPSALIEHAGSVLSPESNSVAYQTMGISILLSLLLLTLAIRFCSNKD